MGSSSTGENVALLVEALQKAPGGGARSGGEIVTRS
jgi:hypothetical protein